MTLIFRCKSHEAHAIKVLAELLSNNLKTAVFQIDSQSISLCMPDQHRKILIDLQLFAENFTVYKFKEKKMHMGINMTHFHRMLKNIKKKDSIELFISDTNPNELGIKVIPKENNRITTSYIKIQNIQNISVSLPIIQSKPVIVSSQEYQKMCKDMGNIGNTIKITSKNFHIEFHCDAGGILKRTVQFGESEDNDMDDSENDDIEYSEEFVTESLLRCLKCAGLSSTLQIFPGKPILFKSNIGTIGKIAIYIKSKDQLEDENNIINDDYNSEDE
jgi:proliferating cell nuclear antigen PCNA